MTFNDEFDGASLDLNKWATKYPFRTAGDITDRSNNAEKEWYVDNAQIINNGILTLQAKKECLTSDRPENYSPYDCSRWPYTSGMISSHNSFSQAYGYFEARIKLSANSGLWPAFWLLPMPLNWPPEIDIFENHSADTRLILMNNIFSCNYPLPGDYCGSNTFNYVIPNPQPSFSDDFHLFAVEWTPTWLNFYVDGVQVAHDTNHIPALIPENPSSFTGMYMIANLAVENSDATTGDMQIDYIRVYQKRDSITPSPTPELTPGISPIPTPSSEMTPTPVPSSLLTGLSAYWKLNEISGTRSDSKGTSDLSDNNTVGYATGEVGNAALFSAASSEYLSVNNNSALTTSNTSFTVSGWYYFGSSIQGSVLASKDNVTDRGRVWQLWFDPDNRVLGFDIWNNGYLLDSREVLVNNVNPTPAWHFIVAWFDVANHTLNLQIDNGTVNSISTDTSYTYDSGIPIRLGRIGGPEPYSYDGLIDEFGYWKRLLTSSERNSLFNSGSGLSYPFDSSPTASPTQTITPNPSPTANPTTIPSPTPTMTPTNTPTPTSSPTPTSVLPTASPTSVPSPTPIPAGYVQSNLTYATDFVSSQSTTFSNSVGNGNLVVVGISVYSIGTANISTVTDNKGNIYNRAVSGPSNHDNVSIWYAENVIGGEGFTVTASPSQGATVGITLAIHEYRGMLTSNSLDRTSSNSGTGRNATSGRTTATSAAKELVFGVHLQGSGITRTATTGTGFTRRQNMLNGDYEPLLTEDKFVTATGLYEAPLTWSSSVYWQAAIATFKLE